MSQIDTDGHRSDVLSTLAEALAGPLTAGARSDALEINGNGRVILPLGQWEPLLLVAPQADLVANTVVVNCTVDGKTVAPVTFAPWTERDAFLPLHLPPTNAARVTGAEHTYMLRVTIDGANQPVNTVRDLIAVKFLSGSFGRLFYLMQAETPRLRRLMRQVQNCRALAQPAGANGGMLDRIGQELAVPRLSDRIGVAAGQIVTTEERESDANYRSRLAIYKPFLMSTRRQVEAVLNEGEPAGNPKYHVLEEDNAFQIGLRLVSVAADAARARNERHNYQRFLRETVLIDPTEDVPANRRLPNSRRTQENAQRIRLRTLLSFGGASRSLAPALATALDRVGIAAKALGVGLTIKVGRAQDNDAGSRWELGLAAEIETPAQADIDALADKARTVALKDIPDRQAQSLVARLRASLPNAGPADAAWLLRAAGLRTVHVLGPGKLMLSHFSTEGLVIEGAGDLGRNAAGNAPFTAALLAANDDATNAALAHALAGGTTGWAGGAPSWQRVPNAGLGAEVAALSLPPVVLAARLRALGMLTDFAEDHFRQALTRYPNGIYALLRFDTAFSTALAAQQQAAWDQFGLIVEQLGRNGTAAAVLMAGSGGRLTLVVSAIALPLQAANLAARRSSGFVWRALPITDGSYRMNGAGSRATFVGREGLAAIAVVGYARRGLTDPFEYRVTAREGTSLDIAAYEHLMNTLRHMTPAGVQANTWDIRRNSVALDPAIGPEPLPPRLTRAFRPFRRPRFTGAEAPPVPVAGP